jgi:hypothetical protein
VRLEGDMTKERLEWVLSGLDRKKLNLLEKRFIQGVEKKLSEDLSRLEEKHLEKIYKLKSR